MRAVYAFVVALAMLALAPFAEAQTKVQGVSPITSTAVAWPVMIGGINPSGAVGYVNVDAAGNLILNGIAPTSSSTSVSVNNGVNPAVEHPTPTGEFSSNGTSEVVIAAASNGKVNYLCSFTAENTSLTTIHTVKVKDRVSGKVLWRATLAPGSSSSPGGQAWTELNHGAYQSGVGSALVVILGDAGGTDVTMTANTVTK